MLVENKFKSACSTNGRRVIVLLQFAANLTMLFTEVPFMDRFSLAQKEGFRFVEYLFPYEYELDRLKEELSQNGLKQILFNLPSGNWAAGDRGIAADSARIEEFRAGVSVGIEYALGLGVNQVNCLAGKTVSGFSYEEQWSTLVENVRYAAKALADKKLNLVIEPINHFDIPGFFLNKTEQVVKLIDEVAMPNVFVQYDVYHAQREEGELTNTLRKHINKIAHIQIADNPGRHQPGTGEINYPHIFDTLERLGYQGYVGLEYIPQPGSTESLKWIKEFGYTL